MPRKKQVQEEYKPDTVTMFLSLMILLLAFFIVLVSMSTIEEKKKETVLKSIYATFGALPGGTSPFFSLGMISPDAAPPVKKLDLDFKAIKEIAYQKIGEDKVALKTSGNRRIISIESAALFDPEGFRLRPSALPFLREVARTVKGGDYFIQVAGHTDDIPPDPKGPAKDNWQLSAYRALAVLRVLVEAGVDQSRLAAYGYGPLKPLRPNTSLENRMMNHRVEIVLDESLAGPVERLKAIKSGGRLRFKGFVFDLFGEETGEGKKE